MSEKMRAESFEAFMKDVRSNLLRDRRHLQQARTVEEYEANLSLVKKQVAWEFSSYLRELEPWKWKNHK
jgi:hypothetical protein